MSNLWTMRTGEKIKVADMSDSHLANTLRMLKKNAEATAKLLEWVDTDCNDMRVVQDGYWPDYTPPIFKTMEHEAQHRGLEWE